LTSIPAGLVFGGVWQEWGAPFAFALAAIFAFGACIWLKFKVEEVSFS